MNRLKKVQDCRMITGRFRGICRTEYPNLIKENWRMSSCNRLDLQTLGPQLVIMPQNLPNHWSWPLTPTMSGRPACLPMEGRKRTKFVLSTNGMHKFNMSFRVLHFYILGSTSWIWTHPSTEALKLESRSKWNSYEDFDLDHWPQPWVAGLWKEGNEQNLFCKRMKCTSSIRVLCCISIFLDRRLGFEPALQLKR